MTVLVFAGTLGLLGSGPLGRGSVSTPDGSVRVDYERFLRRGTRTTLLVRARPASPDPPGLALRLAQPYVDRMRVESVFPPPRRVRAGGDHVILDFDVDPRQPELYTVAIELLPLGIGGRWGTVGVEAGPQLGFRQWVNP
jgi:hypothetical protein